jgi:hypothetical protein
MNRWLGGVLLAAITLLPAAAQDAAPMTAAITAYPIENFAIGGSETRFGALEFAGGFTMTSPNRNFGALSSFRFLDGTGTRFAAVADTGFFITGSVMRDHVTFAPNGFSTLTFQELPDLEGRISNAKWETDSESLDVEGDQVVIGFERRHRLTVFPFADGSLGAPAGMLDFLISADELRGNRGFETLARAPVSGPLEGALVAVSEKSIDAEGNIYAAILSGPKKGIFKIARSDEFDITDGDFLPDGDLMILERSYGMAQGVRMRIRLIDKNALQAGATVEGAILIEADMTSQIDNMEGLDAWQAPDGTTRVSLVSDDNKSILQRNLYLEFVLKK